MTPSSLVIFLFGLLGLYMVRGFPIGINLTPLGGNFQAYNHDSAATYVFADLFKHCNAFYIRSVSNMTSSSPFHPSVLLSAVLFRFM